MARTSKRGGTAALSSVDDSPRLRPGGPPSRRLPPPPCSCTHHTPLTGTDQAPQVPSTMIDRTGPRRTGRWDEPSCCGRSVKSTVSPWNPRSVRGVRGVREHREAPRCHHQQHQEGQGGRTGRPQVDGVDRVATARRLPGPARRRPAPGSPSRGRPRRRAARPARRWRPRRTAPRPWSGRSGGRRGPRRWSCRVRPSRRVDWTPTISGSWKRPERARPAAASAGSAARPRPGRGGRGRRAGSGAAAPMPSIGRVAEADAPVDVLAEGRGHRPAQRPYGQHESGGDRAEAEHRLGVGRQEDRRRDHQQAQRAQRQVDRGDRAAAPHPAGDDRLGGPAFDRTTTSRDQARVPCRTGRARAPTARPRRPRPAPARSAARRRRRRRPGRPPSRHAAPGPPAAALRLVQVTDDQPQRHRAERQVDRGRSSASPRTRRGLRPARGPPPPRPPTPWTAWPGSSGVPRAGTGRRRGSARCPGGRRRPGPGRSRKAISAAMFQAQRAQQRAEQEQRRRPRPGPACGRRCRRACRRRAG